MGNSDSKAQFRGLVFAFSEKTLSPESKIWEQLWLIPQTAEDVFSLIQPDDVAAILEKQPENLRVLVSKTLEEIRSNLSNPIKFSTGRTLNCVRVLTRVIPTLQLDSDEENKMLWNSETNSLPLAQDILHVLSQLLFFPGFTLAESTEVSSALGTIDTEEKLLSDCVTLWNAKPALLWTSGIGVFPDQDGMGIEIKVPETTSTKIRQNRSECLRLLFACFSKTLYIKAVDYTPSANKWLTLVCEEASAFPRGVELFCSMLNFACSYDPIGWGIPYGSTLTSRSAVDEELVDICLQLLLILIDSENQENYFSRLIGSIDCEKDFKFLFDGMSRLLNSIHSSHNTYLPNSKKSISCEQEVLVLFWKLIVGNRKFLTYILHKEDITKILVPIVYFIWNGRQNPGRTGLVHIGTFVLLVLSGERTFGVALNKPFKQRLPLDGAPVLTTGNHADLIIILFHKLIVNGSGLYIKLYGCLMTIIANISPYAKSLSLVASIKLMSMFEQFSSRRFLFAAEDNPGCLNFLLDTFNNLIQYQYEGNYHVIYTLCRNKALFDNLKNMEFQPESDPQPKANSITPENSSEQVASRMTSFIPTEEWFNKWKSDLHINTVARLLDYLQPHVENFCASNGITSANEKSVMNFLKNTTLVGLLPVPHAIVIRKYEPNKFTTLWFTTYIWGVFFIRNKKYPLWEREKIKLFAINVS
mmetsp:Transcript_5099/g.5796  ORF Transcript_5099/g.5796 Transcript_5099/m.5796 type:complete len:699 (+) Transcript_5099:47-2143(+)